MFLGPLIPLFWTSGEVPSGFQSHTFPEIHLRCDTFASMYGQNSSWRLSLWVRFSRWKTSRLAVRCVNNSSTNKGLPNRKSGLPNGNSVYFINIGHSQTSLTFCSRQVFTSCKDSLSSSVFTSCYYIPHI